MAFEYRQSEGQKINRAAVNLFSRVSGWTGRAAAMRVRHILGPSLKPDDRVMDIGTGPGVIPLHLQRFYSETYFIGLDISWEMLEMAFCRSRRMNVPLILLAGDGEFLPFVAETFDVITSFFALHHMDQPKKLLREIDRVLKPNGTVLVIDFRRDMSRGLFRLLDTLWQLTFYRSAGQFGFRDSVRSAWSQEEIIKILNQNGLSRLRVHANRMELWIRDCHDIT